MAIIDRVKWDGSPDILAWKFPSEELSTWTQLIVNESQEAFIVRSGVYDGPFGGGRHTLTTANLPLLRTLIGIPFGGQSPFSAEVWYVNKVINLDIKWGTPDPIQLQDPKYQVMIPVRAFGQLGIQVSHPKTFLLKLVGTLPSFDVTLLSNYFRGISITKIKTHIAKQISDIGIPILNISSHLEAVSNVLKEALTKDLEEYGIRLSQFNVHSINVPEEDPAVISLKAALAKKAEMGILGFNYQQERSFDVLQTAAGNEGTAGGVLGAGLGAGMGIGLGGSIGQGMAQIASTATGSSGIAAMIGGQPKPSAMTHEEKIQALKDLAGLKDQGILSDHEFAKEKEKILAN